MVKSLKTMYVDYIDAAVIDILYIYNAIISTYLWNSYYIVCDKFSNIQDFKLSGNYYWEGGNTVEVDTT